MAYEPAIVSEQYQEGYLPSEAQGVEIIPEEEYPVIDEETRAIDILNRFASMANIAEKIEREELVKIGSRVVSDYKVDKKSRSKWEEDNDKWMKLAQLTVEKKNFPHPNAANIKYPTVAQAAIQFASRAYLSILSDKAIVKSKVIGRDEDGKKAARGQRRAEHMNYQLTEEMSSWEEDTDRLLINFAITGLAYRKTYRDINDGKNVSEFMSAKDVIVNKWAPGLERANRVTQVFELYPNEIEEMVRSGQFLDIDYGTAEITGENAKEGKESGGSDEDAPHVFLEQHRWWDLDGDGYQEPYIVTVHLQSREVVRIAIRYDLEGIIKDDKENIIKIKPVHYFTSFIFIPAFDGSYYPIGYGALLGPGAEIINSSFNQILDAGTSANTGGGFISSALDIAGSRGGDTISFAPNEWKIVNASMEDLRKGILPKPVVTPSAVTFNMLSLMIEANEKLSSVSELMTGQQPVSNVPATTSMISVEQALKMFTAVHKRIHNSLKSEFKKIVRLNRIFLDDEEYYNITDKERSIARADYDTTDCDIVPASNPNDVTDTMRLLSAQALLELKNWGLDEGEITKRYLEALHIPDIEKLIREQQEEKPDPALEIETRKLDLEAQRVEMEGKKIDADVRKSKADAIKALADAESKEAGTQMNIYKAEAEALDKENELSSAKEKLNEPTDDKRNVGTSKGLTSF